MNNKDRIEGVIDKNDKYLSELLSILDSNEKDKSSEKFLQKVFEFVELKEFITGFEYNMDKHYPEIYSACIKITIHIGIIKFTRFLYNSGLKVNLIEKVVKNQLESIKKIVPKDG